MKLLNIRQMETDLCDPCLGEDKSVPAIRFCFDCEERLCKNCVESHSKFKAFKLHHVTVLSENLKTPRVEMKFCKIHDKIVRDFYCSQHENICCRLCIPESHQTCKTVIPLDDAAKHVKQSSLLSDREKELIYLTEILKKLAESRENNLDHLAKTNLGILQNIKLVKEKLLKQVDDMERTLTIQLSSLKQKIESVLKAELTEISKAGSIVDNLKQTLEAAKDEWSDKQLFLSLHDQQELLKETERKIQEIASSIKTMDIEFKRVQDLNLETLGSVEETVKPCNIKYSPIKWKVAQSSKVEDNASKFKQPTQILIRDLNPRKIDYVINSQTAREVLDGLLLHHHGIVEWPENKNSVDSLKVNNVLSDEVEDYITLAKEWESTIKAEVQGFFDLLKVNTYKISKKSWSDVINKLREINVSNPEATRVRVEKNENKIFVVGYKKEVMDLSKLVEDIIEHV